MESNEKEYKEIMEEIKTIMIAKGKIKSIEKIFSIDFEKSQKMLDEILIKQAERLIEIIDEKNATFHTVSLCAAEIKRLGKIVMLTDNFEKRINVARKRAAYNEAKKILNTEPVDTKKIQISVGQKNISWEDISAIVGFQIKGVGKLEEYLKFKRLK